MDGGDSLGGFLVILTLAAIFWVVAAGVLWAIILVSAMLAFWMLPAFIGGFIAGLREERKAEDSNPNRQSDPTG